MDKHHKKATEWAIKANYGRVIFEVIMEYLVRALDEMRTAVFTFKSQEMLINNMTNRQRAEQALREALSTDSGRKELRIKLNIINAKRGDIIEEILKQYGLNKTDDSTLYYDIMQQIFSGHMNHITKIVMAGSMSELFKMVDAS